MLNEETDRKSEAKNRLRGALIALFLWLIIGILILNNFFALIGIIIVLVYLAVFYIIIPPKVRYTLAVLPGFPCYITIIYLVVYGFFLEITYEEISELIISIIFVVIPLIFIIIHILYMRKKLID